MSSHAQAGEVLADLESRGLSLAFAESLTAGGLTASAGAIPGASAVLRGGIVAYATEVKHEVLGVPAQVIEREGAVSAQCAQAMAEGVRDGLSADVGVATTGIAGPDSQEGKPVGLVYVAVAVPGHDTAVAELRLDGDRGEVVHAAIEHAWRLLAESLGTEHSRLG